MPDPLTALSTMGITTMEELQALITLFTHQKRIPAMMYGEQAQPGPSTPHWQDDKLVNNTGIPVDDYTIAAENLTKDYSSGSSTGKRHARLNPRP